MSATRIEPARAPGWRRSLMELRQTPERYDDQRIGWGAARRILRCDDATLAELVDWGLPHREAAGVTDFGACDVMNLGLYSRSGRSVPELAERHLMRFAGAGATSWLEPRSWRVTLELRCRRGLDCAREPWRIPLPDAHRFGGSTSPWRRSGGETLRASGVKSAELDAVTRGAIQRVEAPAVRELYHEVLDHLLSGHWRYQYMPHSLRLDPTAAAANGTMDCVSTGLWMHRRCRELGIECRTRKGFILSVPGVEHVWVEVRDDDSRWVVLDPVLGALALRAVGPSGRQFADFSLGSISNRILPWPRSAAEPIFGHPCPRENGLDVISALSAAPSDGAVAPAPRPPGAASRPR